jgi:benzoyl-CoA 2,3-epoxidase subunit B
MIEEILSMNTGSHVLGAFNIDFDSFVDNVVFCALIDRVGKYQLTMQKQSAYQPMAESMPQMLREEAFHLAAGVVPMRRWATSAARDSGFVSMEMLQQALNKWMPRGLEMFGDERGGGTNVRYGLKPLKNAEAQRLYREEVGKVVRDLNLRWLRARQPGLSLAEAPLALDRILAGETVATLEGVRREDLLRLPHAEFFRRRGMPAFRMVGVDGEEFTDVHAYLRHVAAALPDAYRAGRDYKEYAEVLVKVQSGELTVEAATSQMPALRRVGGACPCSKSVRWVVDAPAAAASSTAPAMAGSAATASPAGAA